MDTKERLQCRDEVVHYMKLLDQLFSKNIPDWNGEDYKDVESALNVMMSVAAKISYRTRILRDDLRWNKKLRVRAEKIRIEKEEKKIKIRIKQEKEILKAQREEILKVPEKENYWKERVRRQERILGNLQRDLKLMRENRRIH